MGTRFSWDAEKARRNRIKHRVSFELAMRVFSDPMAISVQDRVESGEVRWPTIGAVEGYTLLVVAHTWKDDRGTEVIRIISARRADRTERRRMKTETVEHLVDLEDLRELSDSERAELADLRSLSDDDIDRSDIPALTDEAWRRAVRTPYFGLRRLQRASDQTPIFSLGSRRRARNMRYAFTLCCGVP